MDIQDIRTAMKSSPSDADRVMKFMALLKHPQLTWQDMLDALAYRVIIAEQAAFRLHALLATPIPPAGPITDAGRWQQILCEKGIDAQSRISYEERSL